MVLRLSIPRVGPKGEKIYLATDRRSQLAKNEKKQKADQIMERLSAIVCRQVEKSVIGGDSEREGV